MPNLSVKLDGTIGDGLQLFGQFAVLSSRHVNIGYPTHQKDQQRICFREKSIQCCPPLILAFYKGASRSAIKYGALQTKPLPIAYSSALP